MLGLTVINVQVISEEIIKPSCPTPNHLRSLPASLFDHVNEPILMPLVYFYYQNHITKIGTTEILERLKTSLPETLSLFYPLAGRFKDSSHISCNDEGVPYVEAEVDIPLKDVVHKAEVSQIDKLLPSYGQEGYTNLLLAIQVNRFSCGGLAIGVKVSHAISDGFSSLMFVKTWASTANNNHQSTLNYLPCFGIQKLFPPSSPHADVTSLSTDIIKVRPVTKWFKFRNTQLATLRSKMFPEIINNGNENDVCHHKASLPSLAMILSAFLWSRIKLVCHSSVNNIPFEVFHAVNVRPRVSPPNEQSYYFGNMVVNAIVKFREMIVNDKDKLSSQRDFLQQTKKSIGKIQDDEFVREMQEGKEDLSFIMDQFGRLTREEIVLHGFSNLRSLPVYEADFGWGKPVWVTSATLTYENLVILIPAGPSNKDIVAYISLTCEDMAKLQSDEEFGAFVNS